MVSAKYHTPASIRAWQKTSPAYQHLIRGIRIFYSLGLFTLQLPFLAIDRLLNLGIYGRPSWSLSFRAVRLLGSYIVWSLNPATRPASDVTSWEARCAIGRLSKGRRAELVLVPARPDLALGDAKCQSVLPKDVPCFWMGLDGMPEPVTESTPMSERKVMMYFVGGGMVQGHPLRSPLGWKLMSHTKIPIFGVNFRKCAQLSDAFPGALQDATAALYFLLAQGYLPSNICMMGDSGGGGIIVTTILHLLRHSLQLPGSVMLISPWVDLVDTLLSDEEHARERLRRDFLNPEMLSMAAYQYCDNRPELRATLLSPNRNELPEGYSFKGFPRTLLAYGDAEMFAQSEVELIALLRAAGVEVEEVVGRDDVHVYPYYSTDTSPEGFFGRAKAFVC